MEVDHNSLVGAKFEFEGEKFVVTWNDLEYFRATPLVWTAGNIEHSGLASHQFKISDVWLAILALTQDIEAAVIACDSEELLEIPDFLRRDPD